MTRYWYIDEATGLPYGPADAEEVAGIGEGDGWHWEPLTAAEEADYLPGEVYYK